MAGAAGTNKSSSSSAELMACSALMMEATRAVCQSRLFLLNRHVP